MPSGVLTFQFGVYDGELNEAGLRHGFGKLKYNNGNEVEGQWVDGGLTGVGKKTFANGDVYEGSFETGKKHGHGTYTFKAGGCYTGGYEYDLQHGFGKWEAGREQFEGTYVKGKREGMGTETTAKSNGEAQVYEGEWHNSQRHGQGTVVFADGQSWVGRWEDGKPVEGNTYDSQGNQVTEATAEAPSRSKTLAAVPAEPPVAASSLFDALGTGDGSPEAAAVQARLMQAFQGVDNFGRSITDSLSKATEGLDSLEAQLAGLTDALGFDDADFDTGFAGDADPEAMAQALKELENLGLDGLGSELDPAQGTTDSSPEGAEVISKCTDINSALLSELSSAEAELERLRSK
ncbi:Phosphatidylinositol 4-phosphate 5-kinase 8 [Diplonema papillatum]|nr:Phosphatidylinositol 4-phosphate 5-kinase 8 [Diplonema papillatum]